MGIAKSTLQLKTTLDENKAAEQLKEALDVRKLTYGNTAGIAFMGDFHPAARDFNIAYYDKRCKCAIIKGLYRVENDQSLTLDLNIHLPFFEMFSILGGALLAGAIPFYYSAHYTPLPVFMFVFCFALVLAVSAFYAFAYLTGVKKAKAAFLSKAAPYIKSVKED